MVRNRIDTPNLALTSSLFLSVSVWLTCVIKSTLHYILRPLMLCVSLTQLGCGVYSRVQMPNVLGIILIRLNKRLSAILHHWTDLTNVICGTHRRRRRRNIEFRRRVLHLYREIAHPSSPSVSGTRIVPVRLGERSSWSIVVIKYDWREHQMRPSDRLTFLPMYFLKSRPQCLALCHIRQSKKLFFPLLFSKEKFFFSFGYQRHEKISPFRFETWQF